MGKYRGTSIYHWLQSKGVSFRGMLDYERNALLRQYRLSWIDAMIEQYKHLPNPS